MKRHLSLLLPFFLLSACESTGSSSSSVPLPRPSDSARIAISGRTESATFAPNETKIKDTLHSIEDDLHYNTQFLPSVGEVNILVIPVLIPGYADFPLAGFPEQTGEAERLAKVKDDIQTAFFGEEEETGFHSVASYYERSSNGLLRLGGEVTDWFDIQAEMGISSAAEITIGLTYDTPREKLVKICADLKAMMNADDQVIAGSAEATLSSFSASSIDIDARCYVTALGGADFRAMTDKLNWKIMDLVAADGCEFAFPSTTVYLAKNEDGKS